MHNSQKDEFDYWVGKWEQALESDEFKYSEPAKRPFVGDSSEDQDIQDLQYLFDNYNVNNKVINEFLNEHTKEDFIKKTKAMGSSANPIRPQTIGDDKHSEEDVVAGATYNAEQLKSLDEMKKKLHTLGDEVAKDVTNVDSALDKKIKKLQQEIDDLSTQMCQPKVPDQSSD